MSTENVKWRRTGEFRKPRDGEWYEVWIVDTAGRVMFHAHADVRQYQLYMSEEIAEDCWILEKVE